MRCVLEKIDALRLGRASYDESPTAVTREPRALDAQGFETSQWLMVRPEEITGWFLTH